MGIVESKEHINKNIVNIVSYDMNNICIISLESFIGKLFDDVFNDADIVCIQNINEKLFYIELLSRLLKSKNNYFIAPTNKNTGNGGSVSIKQIWDGSLDTDSYINNIIISKFPIIDYFYKKISDTHHKYIVCANIILNENKIICICSVNLTDDIKSINFRNERARRNQILLIKSLITKMIAKHNSYLFILCGSFCIDEIVDNKVNNEYIDLISSINLLDIFRYYNNNTEGFTNIYKTRNNYIFVITNEPIIFNIKEQNNIIRINKYLYDNFKIKLLDFIVKNNTLNYTSNFSIRLIFSIS